MIDIDLQSDSKLREKSLMTIDVIPQKARVAPLNIYDAVWKGRLESLKKLRLGKSGMSLDLESRQRRFKSCTSDQFNKRVIR